MGNAANKLKPEDVASLEGLDLTTGMDVKELLKEYKKFRKQFPTGGIDLEAFKRLAEVFLPPQQRNMEFISRLFCAFDADKSGEIDFKEFMLALNYSTSDNPEEKLSFYFKTLDVDGSGFITDQDLLYAVELIFKHNPGLDQRVGPDINTPEKVVKQIFASVDANHDGRLSCQELLDFMSTNPKKFTYLGLNLIFLP